MPRFPCQPCDASFFDSAAERYRETFTIPKPTDQVWAELTGETPLAWCRALSRITWTSPLPRGVGATRTARVLGGFITLDERFFRWEEGRRKSFHVVALNQPLARRFGEDYLLEPLPGGATRFTWTIALEPTWLGRVARPVNAKLIASLFEDTRRHYGIT